MTCPDAVVRSMLAGLRSKNAALQAPQNEASQPEAAAAAGYVGASQATMCYQPLPLQFSQRSPAKFHSFTQPELSSYDHGPGLSKLTSSLYIWDFGATSVKLPLLFIDAHDDVQ